MTIHNVYGVRCKRSLGNSHSFLSISSLVAITATTLASSKYLVATIVMFMDMVINVFSQSILYPSFFGSKQKLRPGYNSVLFLFLLLATSCQHILGVIRAVTLKCIAAVIFVSNIVLILWLFLFLC